jgi:hypothetical protein
VATAVVIAITEEDTNVTEEDTSVTEEDTSVTEEGAPIRPWLTSDGGVNFQFLAGLKRRVLGVTLSRPGISEWEVIRVHLSPALTPRCARVGGGESSELCSRG